MEKTEDEKEKNGDDEPKKEKNEKNEDDEQKEQISNLPKNKDDIHDEKSKQMITIIRKRKTKVYAKELFDASFEEVRKRDKRSCLRLFCDYIITSLSFLNPLSLTNKYSLISQQYSIYFFSFGLALYLDILLFNKKRITEKTKNQYIALNFKLSKGAISLFIAGITLFFLEKLPFYDNILIKNENAKILILLI